MGNEWRRSRHRLGTPGLYHCVLIPTVADGVALRRSSWFASLLRLLGLPRRWHVPALAVSDRGRQVADPATA
jgi:hypothetical protein